MANSLLDFVMSLVRDPDAAARYAADPAAAIAEADLGDVTSADVDQLIPVVTDSFSSASLSSAGPAMDPGDWAGATAGLDSNVWASGAATAAFDAFGIDDAVPVVAHDLDDFAVPELVHTTEAGTDVVSGIGTGIDLDEEYADPLVDQVVDDLPLHDTAVDQAWSAPDPAGFDLFD